MAWLRSVIVGCVIAVAIWGSHATNQTLVYTATAELTFVKAKRFQLSAIRQAAIGVAPIRRVAWSDPDINTYLAILRSAKIARMVKGSLTPDEIQLVYRANAGATSDEGWPKIAFGFTRTDPVGFISVTAEHPNPKAAELIAHRYAETFITDLIQFRKASAEESDAYLVDLIARTPSLPAEQKAKLMERRRNRTVTEEDTDFRYTKKPSARRKSWAGF